MDEALVIFGKSAQPGKVKTRLCPPLSEEEAARLYEAFARDVFETAARYQEERRRKSGQKLTVVLAWEGVSSDTLARVARRELGFEIMDQGKGDLGDRLQRVSVKCRRRGARTILVLGTDSPTLSVEHLHTARLALKRCDVVFGPAFDGGYYLIGLGEKKSELVAPEAVVFDEIPWSTKDVMERSWRCATEQGLLCDLLGYWYDIDTFEDLIRAKFHLFEYLASRDPLVGQHTRSLLESEAFEAIGKEKRKL